MGVLDVQAGRGTFITEDLSDLSAKQLELSLLIGQKEQIQLLEARQILEGAIAGLAARRATADEIAEIDTLCRQMGEAVSSGNREALTKLDVSFHLKLAEACHNPVLVRMARTLHDLMGHSVRANPDPVESLAPHTRVCNALRDGDGDEARRAMDELLATTGQRLELIQGSDG
jgi:GntR family transcriptional repressor for pyruvate dehydrogenase complex